MPALIGADLQHLAAHVAVESHPVEPVVGVVDLAGHRRHQRDRVGLALGEAGNGLREILVVDAAHGRSMAIAVPSPPPMQIAATPRLSPRFSSAFRSVTMIRAPEAPIG